ncbi:MAG: monofunctional biosynthetic peptidoglycan transglycosylase [Acidobacteria bacterium]|nr:monofunctional biosynthetic peptidoglycan transglycosylase [Acidobacteriota bacterium]MYE44150.1 monofunctional biosynthetic peptidoglycan transglycosylase [Acidobacteriota bacterium]
MAGEQRFGRWGRIAVGAALGWIALTILFVLPWRWIPPPTTAFMIRERVAGEGTIHYQWARWDDISPHLPIAAVAAEDQKFPGHFGFDFDEIGKALERNRRGGRLRGASTISQQVAKNLYLWPGQTLVRKGLEAYFTVAIELLWPKRRILEVYLNVAEFGPGTFGVLAASRHAFRREPGDLTPRQAATLVAVLPSPKQMSAANPSEYVKRRTREIQAAVAQLGGAAYLGGL